MSAARAMFQAKTTRGQTSSGGGGKDLWTQHANAIVGMESMGQAGDPTCLKLSSCGERDFRDNGGTVVEHGEGSAGRMSGALFSTNLWGVRMSVLQLEGSCWLACRKR